MLGSHPLCDKPFNPTGTLVLTHTNLQLQLSQGHTGEGEQNYISPYPFPMISDYFLA